MEKAPDAFRTIGEVSDILETPAHVLRFWESRFPQIKPVKRTGGRRYYRPSDVALLAGLRLLLHDQGMTIKGVQKVLREQGVRHVAGLGEAMLSPGQEAGGIALGSSGVQEVLDHISTLRPAPPPPAEVIPLAASRQAATPAQDDLFDQGPAQAGPEPRDAPAQGIPSPPAPQLPEHDITPATPVAAQTGSASPGPTASLTWRLRHHDGADLDRSRLLALRARLVALRDRMVEASGDRS